MKFLTAVITLMCILTAGTTVAQISGNASPNPGTGLNYDCFDDGYYLFSEPEWTISPSSAGTVQSVEIRPDHYTSRANILWSQPGAATITVTYGSYYTYNYNVTVACGTLPGAPTNVTIGSPICGTSGSTTITATTGTNGTGIKWYTASTGTGSLVGSLSSYTTPTISTGTTYYVVSTNAGGSCETASRTAVTVPVNAIPAVPTAKVDGSRCGNGTVALSATPASPATSIRWYNSSTAGELIGTGTSFTTLPLEEYARFDHDYYYYAATYNTSTGCTSTSRLEVKARVNSTPSALRFDVSTVYGTGSVWLTAMQELIKKSETSEGYSYPDTSKYQVRWFADSAKAVANTPTFHLAPDYSTPVINSTVTYFVRLKSKVNNCLGPIKRADAVILPLISKLSFKTEIVRTAGIKTETALNSLNDSLKSVNVVYLDGLGRTSQTIAVKASPNGYDVVQPVEYDQHGRVTKQLLPYVAASTNGSLQSGYTLDQANFYQNASKVAHDSHPWSKSVYENSPLGRLKEQTSAGQAWQPGSGHTNTITYGFNTGSTTSEAEAVRKFNPDGTSSGFYAANILNRTESINADGIHTITFTDPTGKTIVTKQQLDETIGGTTVNYLETYYIYDDFGRVKFMIQPEGVAALKANSWTLTMPIKKQFVFQYVYDSRGRVIETRVPGKGWSYTVYNQLNQPVLTQDTLLFRSRKWLFMKYDRAGRVVMTGLYTNTTDTTRTYFQTLLNNKNYNTEKYFETRNSSGTHKYTNVSFPTSGTEVLSVNYYDTYDFDTYGIDGAQISGMATQGQAIGKVTGSKTLIPGTSTWLKKFVFYDNNGRVIQVRNNNHLNATPDNFTTTLYDFEKALQTKTYHNAGTPGATTVVNTYDYYRQGRPKYVRQKNNTGTEQIVVKYEYNELGQLVDKKLHRKSDGNYLQSVDYRYTINGQLASINNTTLDASGTSNDETNDYFGMELLYNNTESGLTTTQRYDGMVSAIKWKSAGAGSGTTGQRSYAYNYDKSGKLETASYAVKGASTWDKETGAQDETMVYDRNGNIKTLTRKHRKHQLSGIIGSYTNETIDNLTYTYANTTSNKLEKITDAASIASGFDNGESTTNNDYEYDVNGNLLFDKNKGIDSIKYNFLGKPVRVKFSDNRVIIYTYDAGGNKLTQRLYNGATLVTTTEYANGFVYEKAGPSGSTTLSFFGSPEGRVVKNGSNLDFEYSIADHQGNTRVVFTSAAPAANTTTVNFESATNNNVLNYTRTNFELFDHTDVSGSTYTYSQKLTGASGSQVGVTKTLKVYPGDKVKIDAFAKYYNPTSTASNLTGFALALTGAFGVSSGSTGEALKAYNTLNNYGGIIAAGGSGGSTSYPKLFVNILLFDKDYNFLDAAWEQIDGGEQVGASPKAAHDLMSKEVTVKEAGYAYVFISHENPTQVEFYIDDITITHTPSNVIQYNEYYPFGLQTSSSWTRESTTGNQFLYNAGNELNATSGWYEMFYRGYDPAIGRMLQIDPYAEMYASFSGYNYAINNPVMMNDPSGGQSYSGSLWEYGPGIDPNTVRRHNAQVYYENPSLYGGAAGWSEDMLFFNVGGQAGNAPQQLDYHNGQYGYWKDYPSSSYFTSKGELEVIAKRSDFITAGVDQTLGVLGLEGVYNWGLREFYYGPKVRALKRYANGSYNQRLLGSLTRNRIVMRTRALSTPTYRALANLQKPTLPVNPNGRFWVPNSGTMWTMRGVGAGGGLLLGYGLYQSGQNIANASNKTAAAINEGFSWGGAIAGGMAGAETGALVGSVFGPVGTLVGGFVGGVVGSVVGGQVGYEIGSEITGY